MTGKEHDSLLGPLWAEYQQTGYGHLLEPGQQATECKRAFYGGAFSAITALLNMVSDGPEPEPGDTALLDRMLEEINVFFVAESATHNAQQH